MYLSAACLVYTVHLSCRVWNRNGRVCMCMYSMYIRLRYCCCDVPGILRLFCVRIWRCKYYSCMCCINYFFWRKGCSLCKSNTIQCSAVTWELTASKILASALSARTICLTFNKSSFEIKSHLLMMTTVANSTYKYAWIMQCGSTYMKDKV